MSINGVAIINDIIFGNYKLTEMFWYKLSHEHQGFAWASDWSMLQLAGNTELELSDLEKAIRKAENPPKTITYGDDESYVPYVREPINPNACPCGRNQGYCALCDVCDGHFSDNKGFSIS